MPLFWVGDCLGAGDSEFLLSAEVGGHISDGCRDLFGNPDDFFAYSYEKYCLSPCEGLQFSHG